MILSTPYLPAGGEGAWWLACWTAGREVWVQDLAGLVLVLCFWAKHFTFTVVLSNQNPVVQRIDISIRWWITIQRISIHKTYCAIQRMGLFTHRTTGARSINVFQRNVKEAWWNAGGGGGPCEGLASHPVGNSNTPCRSMLQRNRDKLPLDGTLDSSTDFSLKILLTYSQGHFWQLWNVWVFDSTL